MWIARERGIAAALYGTAPWMGPGQFCPTTHLSTASIVNRYPVVLGPIVGGWISETKLGWRFAFWIMFIVSALNALACIFITPETVCSDRTGYGVIRLTDDCIVWACTSPPKGTSANESIRGQDRVHIQARHRSLSVDQADPAERHGSPFLYVRAQCSNVCNSTADTTVDFLVTEPIVLLFAIYIAIAYATLYAFFAAYPIVFQRHQHFSAGEGGLAFLGIGLGCIIGLALAPAQNRLYWKAMDRNGGRTIPEA